MISSTLPSLTASGLMIITVTSFLVGTAGKISPRSLWGGVSSTGEVSYLFLVPVPVQVECLLLVLVPLHSDLHPLSVGSFRGEYLVRHRCRKD